MKWNIHREPCYLETHLEICLDESDLWKVRELNLGSIETMDYETFIRYMLYIADHIKEAKI
jgi:hypothetical protein